MNMGKNSNNRDIRILFGEPQQSLRGAIRAALHREGYESTIPNLT
jgi:hypothetical protein